MRLDRGLRYVPGLAALCVASFASGSSQAHFVLTSPPAMTEQDGAGNPQKAPPCGDNGTAVMTEIVTTYQPGDTVTITIDEAIFHPGHYRIALALEDPNDLPPEPIVTPGDTPCGSAPIDPAPVFPVLADGVFEHTDPFAGPQTIDITLPDDVTCTNCTLQVIQFMSNHGLNNPGGCYYHHCATIAIEGDPVAATSTGGDDGPMMTSGDDATTADPTTGAGSADGTGGGGDASASGADDAPGGSGDDATATETTVATGDSDAAADDSDGGCSCSTTGATTGGWLLIGGLGLLGLGRRRRRI